jgi:tetratricopeptide (TPR) repeat protein
MFKIRKNRKEGLADPAHLVDSVEQAARQARENLQWLIAGVVVAVFTGVAVGGFFWVRYQDDYTAVELLREATQAVSDRSNPGGPPPVRQPQDLQKATLIFQKILADFPHSSVAPQAAYLLGNVLSERQDWEGAVKAYQGFLARYGNQRALVPLVYQRMAYAQLAQGKTEEAEKTLTALVQMNDAPNRDQALFELGKINETLNRPEGALAQYQQIVKDHPSSPFAAEASVRIKTLDARRAAPQPSAPTTPPATSPAK